jgi:hypothetical protein
MGKEKREERRRREKREGEERREKREERREEIWTLSTTCYLISYIIHHTSYILHLT